MALTTVPASLSATALTLTTAAQPNITSVGTLTGLTVSGNIAGTLTTAAQTNITSVGTLSSLSVGAITSTGKLSLNDSTYGGWIQSNTSVRIDIDNDNNQTDRAFVVSKNNGATSLLTLSEDTSATFAGAITAGSNITSGNDVYVPNGRFFRFTGASSSSSGGFLFGDSSGTGGSIAFKRNSDSASVLTLNADQTITTGGSVGFRTTADSNYAFIALQNGSLTHGGYMSIQGSTATGLEINASSSSAYSGTVLLAKQSQRTSGGYLARFANSAGDKMVIETGGNVGIGVTPPAHSSLGELLSVNGANLIGVGTSGGYVGYNMYYNSGWKYQAAAASAVISFENDGDLTIRQAGSGSAGAGISYSENFHLDAAGHLGLGMDPSQALDINASDGLSIRFYQSGTFRAGLQVADSSGQMAATSAAQDFVIRSQSNLLFASNGNTERMRIDGNGYLGIGTPNPGWALDVRAANSGVQLQIGRSVGGSIGTGWFGADGTGIHIGPGTYSSGGFDVANPALKIASDGDVGIGTATPLGRLHVKEGSSGVSAANTNFDQLILEDDLHSGMSILSGSSSHGAIYFGDSSTNDIGQIKYRHDSNQLDFTTNGQIRMIINNNGEVGINDTPPTNNSKLTVGGAINQAPGYWSYGNLLRRLSISGPGGSGTFTRTINVATQLKFNAQGGGFMYMLHGWMSDGACGFVHFRNNGSGDQTIIDVYQHVYTAQGITVTASKGTGATEIDFDISSGHVNTHGWYFVLWW